MVKNEVTLKVDVKGINLIKELTEAIEELSNKIKELEDNNVEINIDMNKDVKRK